MFLNLLMIKNMVENYRYDSIPVGTFEDLAEMQSCGEWFEPGEGLQGLEPKRPKVRFSSIFVFAMT